MWILLNNIDRLEERGGYMIYKVLADNYKEYKKGNYFFSDKVIESTKVEVIENNVNKKLEKDDFYLTIHRPSENTELRGIPLKWSTLRNYSNFMKIEYTIKGG